MRREPLGRERNGARLAAAWIAVSMLAAVGLAKEPGDTAAHHGASVFTLASRAFERGEPIPQVYTADGADISPPLAWHHAPSGTKAYVLVCEDPDAPGGTWVHWVLYDIPATLEALPENVPQARRVLGSARQGENDFGEIGYGGPAPPPGKPHRYFFTLYALDEVTGLEAGARKRTLLKRIKGHVLGTARVFGIYGR